VSREEEAGNVELPHDGESVDLGDESRGLSEGVDPIVEFFTTTLPSRTGLL